jgi:photosystem II stability/assembly factor-like uncharacterized protein
MSRIHTMALVGAVLGAPLAAQERIPDNPRLRWEFFYQKRAFPFDRIPADAVARAQAQAAALRSSLRMAPPPISGSQWTSIGPAAIPISGGSIGRLTAIAVHPTDPATIYIGGAQGGVWKTTDGGAGWVPLTDGECSLAMGWLAIDPVNPDIVYAGTGEQHFSGDSYYGCGLLRSTNGGVSWTQHGASVFRTSTGGARISRVVLDPSTAGTVSSTRLYVASDFGLHVSADGGGSFTQVLSGIVTDLVIDPTNPAILYAAVRGSGVYKSTNSGAGWTLQGTGFATAMQRINLAIAPSAPGTLYASVQGSGSSLAGIWRTTDGAATWTQATATNASCGNQCWYDMTIAVDPATPDVVYFGGVVLYKSTDGAEFFSNITGGIHVDQHVLVFAPSDAGQLFVGNDGGIYRSVNGGSSWTSLNTNLVLTQFYEGIALHPWDPQIVLGGTQDNGTLLSSGVPTWSHVLGGDGGFTAIDYRNPVTRYAETQWAANSGYSGPRRSDGGSYVLKTSGINLGDRALFIPPLVMDPTDPAVLYFGTYRVYRTANRAESWTLLSPDLSGGNGRVSAIAPAAADPAVLYVGTSDGLVQFTANGGATWTPRSLPTSGPRYVQDIAVDPRDPLTAWVVVSGFLTPHVFRTTNGGATFTNVSGSLPDTPVNAVVVDPTSRGTVVIGTDLGAYMSADSGGTWTPLTSGMPNVAIFALGYNASTGTLIAATHGRGMFQLQLDRPLTLAVVDGIASDTVSAGSTTPRTDSATVILSGTDALTSSWSATFTAPRPGSRSRRMRGRDRAPAVDAGTRPDGRVRRDGGWYVRSHDITDSATCCASARHTRSIPRPARARAPLAARGGHHVDTIRVRRAGCIDTVQILRPLVLETASRRDTAEAGSLTPVPDSVVVTLQGPGSTTATWTATHGGGAWLTLTAATGTGSGMARWTRSPAGLLPGAYVDTIRVATSLGDTAVVIDTFVLLAPAVTASCAAEDLLVPGCLTDVQRRYLDLAGNADGTYNLGDLVAFRKRTAQLNATERRP